jgi:hypothetical protein
MVAFDFFWLSQANAYANDCWRAVEVIRQHLSVLVRELGEVTKSSTYLPLSRPSAHHSLSISSHAPSPELLALLVLDARLVHLLFYLGCLSACESVTSCLSFNPAIMTKLIRPKGERDVAAILLLLICLLTVSWSAWCYDSLRSTDL